MSTADPLAELECAVEADPENKRLRQALELARKALVSIEEVDDNEPIRCVMTRDCLEVEVDNPCRVNNGFEIKNAKVVQLLEIAGRRAWRVRAEGGVELVARHPDAAW